MSTYQGPCLPHCYKCSPVTMILSHFSLVYMIACVVYLLFTRNIGTPFQKSLSQQQKSIKKSAAYLRGKIFLVGIIIGFLALYFIHPYEPDSASN